MPVDAPAPVTPADAPVRQRRRGLIVAGIGLWNLWVWVTRLLNLVRADSDTPFAFDLIHAVLYVGSLALALVLLVVGARMVRESRRQASR